MNTGLGELAEWLRSGLQIRVHRFDSGTRLQYFRLFAASRRHARVLWSASWRPRDSFSSHLSIPHALPPHGLCPPGGDPAPCLVHPGAGLTGEGLRGPSAVPCSMEVAAGKAARPIHDGHLGPRRPMPGAGAAALLAPAVADAAVPVRALIRRLSTYPPTGQEDWPPGEHRLVSTWQQARPAKRSGHDADAVRVVPNRVGRIPARQRGPVSPVPRGVRCRGRWTRRRPAAARSRSAAPRSPRPSG